MNCSECQDLLVDYALSALDADERQQARAHLDSGCADCAAELASVEATLAQLPLALNPVAPPAELRARLMERVGQSGTRWSSASASRPMRIDSTARRPASRWIEPLIAGGLAAAITGGVLWVKIDRQQREMADLRNEILTQEARLNQVQATLDQERGTLRLFASPAVQLVALQGAEDQPAAKARVFWDKDREAFHLYASNLKQLSPDKAYELWFINSDQKKIPGGTFRANSHGEATFTVKPPADLGTVAALAVTAEPAGGSPQPTGHVLLLGKAS